MDSFDEDFYVPSFSESILLNRAAGYFSLYSLILSIDGIIRFIRKGGKINILCSPDLSESDSKLIDACISLTKEHVTKNLIKTITEQKLTDDEIDKLDIICNMISEGLMTIKIGYQPLGIFHEKFGIFIDENQDKVYFNGSLNETKSAHIYNHESVRVNASWHDERSANLIAHECEYFDALWSNKIENVLVIDFPEAVEQELLIRYKRSDTLQTAIDNYIGKQSKGSKKILYGYQEEAIRQFFENGYNHFYEMATGTGKTFTSIKTLQRLQEKINEKMFVVICVPQVDLQTQWEAGLKEEGYEKIYLFGGNGTSFDRTISEASIAYHTEDNDVVCIAVYDTFFSKVYDKIKRIDSLFIIVDEAHNLTKGNLATLKKLNPKYKLGLSATIQRFDEGESLAIAQFFTPKSTFYYGIEDAIENGFLSEYEYHPIEVRLKEEEQNKFFQKTKYLAQEMNKEHPDELIIDRLRRERSLILKQASEKIPKLRNLLESGYNFVNSVVYCGQGKDVEGDSIIDTVTKILSSMGLVVSQFTSKTADRKRVLYEFEHGYFDTLAAIKCFDEGVDVPKLDKIYIMASDSALRQTVQRRGRVLRKCKESGKSIAYIYDFIVLPAYEAGTYGLDNLINSELSRAKEYNRLALNKDENEIFFIEIEKEYHITNNETENDETESN